MSKKILFINQEIVPYMPESEMATMGKLLSHKIQENGYEIRTFMPKWGAINERRGQLHEVKRLSGMNMIINDTDYPLIIKVASIPQVRIQVFFIYNEEFFQKRNLNNEQMAEEYNDNAERSVFFARGVLETVKKLGWAPDLIHCQGWMSGVVPFYIKTAYHDEPYFANTKVVTTLFNQQPQGSLGNEFKDCIAFKNATKETLADYKDDFDFIELGKLAINYSDGLVTASDSLDIKLKEYAEASGKPLMHFDANDPELGSLMADFYEKLL